MAGGDGRSDGIATALIYTRVSSDDQAREGLSLDVQLAECRKYSAAKRWLIGREFTDVLSGTNDLRPDYLALLDEARRLSRAGRPAALIVIRLDRLGRRVLERVRCREELKKLGVATHSVREGGEVTDLVANILASVAEEESRRLGERVRDSFSYMRSKGWAKPGCPSFGYCWREANETERKAGAPRKVLEVDPEQAVIVREAFARADRGATFRAISRWLGELPSEVRGGRAWSYVAVGQMLRSRTYIGQFSEAQPGRWEPLVDESVFARVGARIEAHRHMPRQASGRYLLTGLLRCPRCGSRMQGSLGTTDRRPRLNGKLGARKPTVYTCEATGLGASARTGGRPSRCRASINTSKLDAQVRAEVAGLLSSPAGDAKALSRAVSSHWRAISTASARNVEGQRATLEAAAARAKDRVGKLATMYADEAIDRQGYEAGRDRALADLKAAEQALAELGTWAPEPIDWPALEEALRQAGCWPGALERGDLRSQRDVLGLLIDTLTVERRRFGVYDVRIT